MRSFCTTGSIDPQDYYFIPRRLPWGHLNELIERKLYFSIHAPRQSGKSTAAKEFVNYLVKQGKYKPLYCSLDQARNTGNAEASAMQSCLNCLYEAIENAYPEDVETLNYFKEMSTSGMNPRNLIRHCLKFWCRRSAKPVVLFLDEVDGLDGIPLVSLLAQIRAGFEQDRSFKAFPSSIGLISMRNLKDYNLPKGDQEGERRYSPFNILADFIRLSDFEEAEVRTLYLQHTADSGQEFEEKAIQAAYELTQGQPWLVNALAHHACFKDVTDRSLPITEETIQRAKTALIYQHTTHIDNLIERLNEKRVRLVIDAILAGEGHIKSLDADVEYTRNLGLIKSQSFIIANPIYQEVIPRALTKNIEAEMNLNGTWYLNANGQLNMVRLMEEFTKYYRQNAEMLLPDISYHESYPHLLLMAYLQRLVNGGGVIKRECALGKKRADLLIEWKRKIFVLELKVKQSGETLQEGMAQTAAYMDTAGAEEGHLVLFDRDALLLHQKISWEKRISYSLRQYLGKSIHIWTM